MIDSEAIKAEIIKRGYKLKDFALEVGIPEKRLYSSLYRKQMGDKDIAKIQKRLNFVNPWDIFFKE